MGWMTLGNRNGILPRPQRTRSGQTEIASGDPFTHIRSVAVDSPLSVSQSLPQLSIRSLSSRDHRYYCKGTAHLQRREGEKEKFDPFVAVQQYILTTAAILITAEDMTLLPEEAERLRREIDWHTLPLKISCPARLRSPSP